MQDMVRDGSLTVIAALAGALVLSSTPARRKIARAARSTRPIATCTAISPRTCRGDPRKSSSIDTDLFLHAGRGPRRLSKGVGRIHQEPGEDHRTKVAFFPFNRTPPQYEAMRSGRLHVAGVNAGGNALAVNCAGFVPSR